VPFDPNSLKNCCTNIRMPMKQMLNIF